MHVSNWPDSDAPTIEPLLNRLRTVIPDVKTQIHLLQLGNDGEILPHVDNFEASGSWILGLSLGAPRVLRMEKADDENDTFDVLLPSGSVYVQRWAFSLFTIATLKVVTKPKG